MKTASHQIAGVLRDPSQLAGILIYGDDWGQVRDRALSAVKAVVGAVTDPFRSSVLVREEHGRLREEVTSLPLGGGRRAIRVQDATDALAAVLEPLTEYRRDALVVVEASSLTARSKLRAMAEKNPHWACIACYPESSNSVASEIKRDLAGAGLSATPEALDYLGRELMGDSIRRRSELEKLTLYAAGGGVIELDGAMASCVVGPEASLGAAISAALAGRVAACDALLDELEREGATGPGLLAVLSNQVQRVLKVRLAIEDGRTADEACRGLQPPVFPRQMPEFLKEVNRWPSSQLLQLAQAVRDADIACKRAASPDFAIAARLLNAVASRRTSRG